jgi:hypothetical protein
MRGTTGRTRICDTTLLRLVARCPAPARSTLTITLDRVSAWAIAYLHGIDEWQIATTAIGCNLKFALLSHIGFDVAFGSQV